MRTYITLHPQEVDLLDPIVVEAEDDTMTYEWLPNKMYVDLYVEALDLSPQHADALQNQLDRQMGHT